MTDASGAVVEQYRYDAFGQPSFYDPDGTPRGESSIGLRFLFTGREWLSSLALYDYRHRAYSPSLGRFLQMDPLGFAAGEVNVYAYCGNNLLNHIDPYAESVLIIHPNDTAWTRFRKQAFFILFGSLQETRDALLKGAAATADGVLTAATMGGLFGLLDPNLFDAYYDECDSDTKICHVLGQASFVIATIAFTLPQGATRGASQVVSHWGPKGMTELRPGDWVMTGGPNLRNWIMAGAKYSPRSVITTTVPKSALRPVPPTEPFHLIKTVIGQRIYVP